MLIPGEFASCSDGVCRKRGAQLRTGGDGTERFSQFTRALCISEQQRVKTVRKPFAHAGITTHDWRHAAGHRFQYRQIEGVLQRRRDENIRGGIELSDVRRGSAKLYAVEQSRICGRSE